MRSNKKGPRAEASAETGRERKSYPISLVEKSPECDFFGVVLLCCERLGAAIAERRWHHVNFYARSLLTGAERLRSREVAHVK